VKRSDGDEIGPLTEDVADGVAQLDLLPTTRKTPDGAVIIPVAVVAYNDLAASHGNTSMRLESTAGPNGTKTWTPPQRI